MTSSNRWKHRPAFWELQLEADFSSWLQQALRSASPPELQPQQKLLFKNVVAAVTGLEVIEKVVMADTTGDDEDEGKHSKKRKRKTVERFLKDPYNVWFQKDPDEDDAIPLTQIPDGCVQWNEDQDDIPDTVGGKLSKLSVGGLLNALAGQKICERPTVQPKALMKQTVQSGVATQLVATFGKSVTVLGLHNLAYSLHTAVAAVVKEDVLRTTPLRIRELLAPDMSPAEFSGIRKRIYDTVVLGKKLHQPDETELALPTAASAAVHDIEKLKKCHVCGNNDQASFVLDRKNGDVICKHCGSVVSESIMHEGSQFRKFEGEVDRNHHGDAANPLFSNAHNMGTSFSSMAPVTGAGIGGFGSERGGGGGKQNYETILKHAHTYIELNVSQYGKTDRRTRVGYKDRQKKDAFIQMTHAGYSLSLHEAVVQRAKELFSGFRDDRELVQQFKGVLAACLCEAFDQLSAEGKLILRHQQQQQQEFEQDATSADGTPKAMSARAMRRMELHHANKAGKGGNTLNTAEPDAKEEALSAETLKPAAQWDIENCRSWLLEACRRIAQSWVEERKTNPSKPIPPGPLDELEGQLIDHAIRLCERLEEEVQSGQAKQSSSSKVATPRVNDMSKLSIKWQHAHERGSGGKGGVGGSGVAIKARSGRTAGQILILKSAKKLGDILEDKMVGEAIHKELRGVIGKQETQKRKRLREAATQQRFTQMQRKPYLQARAQM